MKVKEQRKIALIKSRASYQVLTQYSKHLVAKPLVYTPNRILSSQEYRRFWFLEFRQIQFTADAEVLRFIADSDFKFGMNDFNRI